MIKKIFLYVFALVGLIMLSVGGVGALNLALKTWIFTESDYPCPTYAPVISDGAKPIPSNPQTECERQQRSQKQNEASNDLALVLVGGPVFFYFLREAKNATKHDK